MSSSVRLSWIARRNADQLRELLPAQRVRQNLERDRILADRVDARYAVRQHRLLGHEFIADADGERLGHLAVLCIELHPLGIGIWPNARLLVGTRESYHRVLALKPPVRVA